MSISSIRRYLKESQGKEENQDKRLYFHAALRWMNVVKTTRDSLSFRRYKSRAQLFRDLWQPYEGLKNILNAAWRVPLLAIAAPFCLAYWAVGVLLSPLLGGSISFFSMKTIGSSFRWGTGHLIYTITLVGSGAVQLAATPIVLVSALARGVLTAIKGWQYFSNNAGVKSLINEGLGIAEANKVGSKMATKGIFKRLHVKMIKAGRQGQPVNIDLSEYNKWRGILVEGYAEEVSHYTFHQMPDNIETGKEQLQSLPEMHPGIILIKNGPLQEVVNGIDSMMYQKMDEESKKRFKYCKDYHIKACSLRYITLGMEKFNEIPAFNVYVLWSNSLDGESEARNPVKSLLSGYPKMLKIMPLPSPALKPDMIEPIKSCLTLFRPLVEEETDAVKIKNFRVEELTSSFDC